MSRKLLALIGMKFKTCNFGSVLKSFSPSNKRPALMVFYQTNKEKKMVLVKVSYGLSSDRFSGNIPRPTSIINIYFRTKLMIEVKKRYGSIGNRNLIPCLLAYVNTTDHIKKFDLDNF